MARRRPDRLAAALAAAFAACALALGACGGDDGKSSSDDNGITRARVHQAGRRDLQEGRAAVQAELPQAAGAHRRQRDVQEPPDQGRADAAHGLRPAGDEAPSASRRIEPPTADRAQVAEITKTATQTLDGVPRVPARGRGRRPRDVHRRRDRCEAPVFLGRPSIHRASNDLPSNCRVEVPEYFPRRPRRRGHGGGRFQQLA